ncbi:hypothetical protein SNEBB_006157 [Seison nebaliae]|nr:hypothetical protein SNEBB_006157 [Seison nebaliae]
MSTIDSISPLQKDIDLRCHTTSPLTVTSLKRTRANIDHGNLHGLQCSVQLTAFGVHIIPPKDTRPKNNLKLSNVPPSKKALIVRDIPVQYIPVPPRKTGNLVNIQSTSNTHPATPAGHTSDVSSTRNALMPKTKNNRKKSKKSKSSLQTHSSSHGPITSLSTTSRPIRNTKPLGLPPIIRNSSEHIDEMAIVPKKRSVIVRGFATNVSTDTIVQFLHNKAIINPVVLKMVSFEQSIFHIIVQQQQLTEIFISELWSSGVMVKKFFFTSKGKAWLKRDFSENETSN